MRFNKKESIVISLVLILALCSLITSVLAEESQAAKELQFSRTDNPYYYPSLNDPSNFLTWRSEFCNQTEGMDFLVQIPPDACSPSPVTSDLLEEQNVPVLCKLTGIKINPLISVPNIKRVVPIVENQSKEIAYISFYPARSALGNYNFNDQFQVSQGSPTMSNLGYLLLFLKQQPVEKNMPKNVSAKIAVNITYDVAKTYGISTEQFLLPILTPQEWSNSHTKYGFWHGKGYLRLQEIKDQNAKIAVYTKPGASPISILDLREGKSGQVNLPGYYCDGPVNISLEEIKIPSDSARFIINGNSYILSERDEFADSGCYVTKVIPGEYLGGEVHISCQGHVGKGQFGDYILKVDPIEAKIKLVDLEHPAGIEKTLKSGDEIETNASSIKKEYYYVGYIGKTADLTIGKGSYSYSDSIVVFALQDKVRIDDENKRHKFVKAIQEVINGKSLESLTAKNILDAVNKNPQVNDQIKDLRLFRKSMGLVQLSTNSKIELLSATGPVQVTYSKEIESDYKEAINYYKTIASQYSRLQNPDGDIYGIVSLRAAADLAGYLSKENDQIELLQSIIDKYQDIEDSYIQGEVEAARSDILLLSQGSGESRSKIIETDSGTYHTTLVSINKPGLNSKEAVLKVNNSDSGVYTVGDQIANLMITEIRDDGIDIIYDEGKVDFITKGTSSMYNGTKIEVISTSIRREAKVTVFPFEKERTTVTNFSVVIGISKRAIQLTPEQINKKIIELNKTIATLNKYVDFLEKTTTTWKKACYVGGTVLWAKNFLTGLSGEAIARRFVMKAWSQKCASEEFRTELGSGRTISLSACYSKNNDPIEDDVNSITSSINAANDFVKEVKSNPGVVSSSGLFGLSKKINEEKFIEYSRDLFLKKYSYLIENVNINVALGSLTTEQKINLLNNEDIKKDSVLYCGDSTNPGKKLVDLLASKDLSKQEKACGIPVPVNVSSVIKNLDALYENGDISSDDIKDMFLSLLINKQKSSISRVLQDYNNFQIFSKFDSYQKIVNEKAFQNQMAEHNVNAPFWASEKTKALVISQIYYLNGNTYNLFSDSDGTPDTRAFLMSLNSQKPFVIFTTRTDKILCMLEQVGEPSENKFRCVPAYNLSNSDPLSINRDGSGNFKTVIQEGENFPDYILLQDVEKCNHEVNAQDYQIRFWESGPYEGLVAQMIISRNEGWYYATKAYSGIEGKMTSYKETGLANEYWICNVGTNGRPEFNFYSGPEGDDDCCFQISKTTNMEIPDKVKGLSDKVEKKCLNQAQTSYANKDRPIKTGDCGNTQPLGRPPTLIPSSQCEDFMSPEDCKILFNLCDPVLCPPSRCDMGGRFPVDNVIQSGIIGSLVLCLGNSDEVAVPICISGLSNGLDALNNLVFKQYKECLQKQLTTGQTTGLCDYWHSVYFCQILWGNLDPFIKAGLPLVTQSLAQGGGEYSLFSEAIKNADSSMGYFTQVYGKNAFLSFKERATNQTGTTICDKFISVVYPTAAKLVDDLTKADSYYSLYASVDEVALGSNPESQYRVFYDIYAGKDKSTSYYVYLKKSSSSSQGYEYQIDQIQVRNAQGFLSPGQTVSNKVDFTAPPGYNQVCVNINGKDHCFLGSGSTSFAIQELQNVYLEDQIKKNIKTEQECKAGSLTLIPTTSLNLQSQITEHIQPEIYRRGIIRICASEDPGKGTESGRYQKIGYCDNQKIGCWLDMNSVNNSISDLGIVEDITEYAQDLSWMDLLDKNLADLPDVTKANITGLRGRLSAARKILYGSSEDRASKDGIYGDYLNKIKEKIYSSANSYNKNSLDDLKILIKSSSVVQDLLDISRDASIVSERALQPDYKAEAQWIQAQALDDRLRFLSLAEVIDAQMVVSGTCEANNGKWMNPLSNEEGKKCPEGTTELQFTQDMGSHQNQVCCVNETAETEVPVGELSQEKIAEFSEGTILLSEMNANGYNNLITIQKLESYLKDKSPSNSPFKTNPQTWAAYFYNLGVEYDIDPAFGLAVAIHESGWGRSQIARNKKNLFNINGTGGFKQYENYEQGIKDFYKLIKEEYVPRNPPQKTPASLICFVNGAYQKSAFNNHCYCASEQGVDPSRGCPSWYSDVPRLRKEIQNLAVTMTTESFLFKWPVQGYGDIQGYVGDSRDGSRNGHSGVDIYAPEGREIYAMYDGTVFSSRNDCSCDSSTSQKMQESYECGGKYGNNVVIKHTINGHTFYTRYAHLKSATVTAGASVRKGQAIGYLGNTGNACFKSRTDSTPDNPHLHFEVQYPNSLYNPKNPLCFFNQQTLSLSGLDAGRFDSRTCTSILSGLGLSASEISSSGTTGVSTVIVIYVKDWLRSRMSVKFDKTKNIWVCENIETSNPDNKACSDFDNFAHTTQERQIVRQLALSDEIQGYTYLKKIYTEKILVSNMKTTTGVAIDEFFNSILSPTGTTPTTPTTPTNPTTPTTPTTPSTSVIQQVLLVSRSASGEYTSENKVVNFNDDVEICVVIKKDDKYYSGKSFTANINNAATSVLTTSDSITRRWYNIQPLWKHPDALSSYFPTVTGSAPYPYYQNNNQSSQLLKNGYDVLQYTQKILSDSDWCISSEKKAGTKWYRVEVTENSQTFYSYGKPSSSSDISNYPSPYKAASQQSNLVSSDSYDTRGISPSVHRISRKSNYENSKASSSEKELIRSVEAYKNVPYILTTDIPRYKSSMGDYISNFKATECAALLIGGAKLTSQGTFVGITDTGSEIVNKARTQNKIIQDTNDNIVEKVALKDILSGTVLIEINENKADAIHIGDIMLMWSQQDNYYFHASMLYEDKGTPGYLDGQDTFIYISTGCHNTNDGQLCYNTPSYFSGISPNAQTTFVRITN
jgi:murein DD-endopeptidase MepM/ murein hydrolase activator NlpD